MDHPPQMNEWSFFNWKLSIISKYGDINRRKTALKIIDFRTQMKEGTQDKASEVPH